MLPRKSNNVWSFMAPLFFRNIAHGKSERHKSIVVESRAYIVSFRSMPISSSAQRCLAWWMSTCAKSAYILQSLFSFASDSVLLETFPHTHVIKFWLLKPETRYYVSKTLTIGYLGKGHTEELIITTKASNFMVSLVAIYTTLKFI